MSPHDKDPHHTEQPPQEPAPGSARPPNTPEQEAYEAEKRLRKENDVRRHEQQEKAADTPHVKPE